MGVLRYAHEYEVDLGNGRVQIYAGHPRYCMQPAKHKLHLFTYVYRLRDGSSAKGSYVCDGNVPNYPLRYMDKELVDETQVYPGEHL